MWHCLACNSYDSQLLTLCFMHKNLSAEVVFNVLCQQFKEVNLKTIQFGNLLAMHLRQLLFHI
jgi:hypothetical protein